MKRRNHHIRVGERPYAFTTGSDEYGSTFLCLATETIHIDGTLEERRKAAQAFAEANGLSVVDTSRPVVVRTPRTRDHLSTT